VTDRVVLAYSGGLDTTVSIPWIQETYGADVVALLVDVGQPRDGLEDALDRATDHGAEEALKVDAREAFAQDHVLPALRANAVYEDAYPLATALARPLIAEHLVGTAQDVDADAVAHGCTAKGNDQVRFEVSIQALAPDLDVVAPAREWRPTRQEALDYAAERDLDLPEPQEESAFSVDENLWGRSVEAGSLEDPAQEIPPEAWDWTTDPRKAPAEPRDVTVGFEAGLPTSLDGEPVDPLTLVETLNDVAGRHGVGRIDHVENRVVGFKSREVYEAPAAEVLLEAHQALEAVTLDPDLAHEKPALEDRYAQLVYEGRWHSPLREALDAFFQQAQQPVTGTATVRCYKGNARVVAREAEAGLYYEDVATYGAGDAFDHDAARGFIDLWSLPLRVAAQQEDPA
jgi:argininosuccinate synthase